jgi:hypothetical protein
MLNRNARAGTSARIADDPTGGADPNVLDFIGH